MIIPNEKFNDLYHVIDNYKINHGTDGKVYLSPILQTPSNLNLLDFDDIKKRNSKANSKKVE